MPPLRLMARGIGEITAAMVVSLLTPLVAYSLQTGSVSPLILITCLPAVAMQLAMLLTIEFPDYEADRVSGKRNLVVRLGPARSARLFYLFVVAAFVLAGLGVAGGVPLLAGLLPLAALPPALLQMWLVRSVVRGNTSWLALMTFLAVALFALLCAAQIAGFVLTA
jgi:1,4-dihydroxy-2-naphthoate octaprenyltransferase